MANYTSPCETCEEKNCSKFCPEWFMNYMERQERINAYAKANGIVPGEPVYQEGKNPCAVCPRDERCTAICKARAKYWDFLMAKLRRNWNAKAL